VAEAGGSRCIFAFERPEEKYNFDGRARLNGLLKRSIHEGFGPQKAKANLDGRAQLNRLLKKSIHEGFEPQKAKANLDGRARL